MTGLSRILSLLALLEGDAADVDVHTSAERLRALLIDVDEELSKMHARPCERRLIVDVLACLWPRGTGQLARKHLTTKSWRNGR